MSRLAAFAADPLNEARAQSLVGELRLAAGDRARAIGAYRAAVDSAERGYVHEQGAVWDPEGRLAAHSRQTLTVFA